MLLNVADDHLDWHGSLAEYTAVKARVFEHQRDDDLLVANLDDPVVAGLAATAPARTRRGHARPDRPDAYTAIDGILRTPAGERDRRGRGAAVARFRTISRTRSTATAAAVAVGGRPGRSARVAA